MSYEVRETSIETESVLAISQRRATGFVLDTQTHIPGSALRGAVARAYLNAEKKGAADKAFQQVFVQEKARFGDHRLRGAMPWPSSVRLCADEPRDHPVQDLLLRMARKESLLARCPVSSSTPGKCDGKLEPARGLFRRGVGTEEPGFVPVTVKEERRMHSAIDPRTLAVMAGQFHSSRVIQAGQHLSGRIAVEREAAWALDEVLAAAGDVLHVGRGRSRGQGRVKIRQEYRFLSNGEEETGEMERRIADFNEQANAGAGIVFSCTFVSPALFFDEWLEPKSRLQGADLDPRLSSYTRIAEFSSWTTISGWHHSAGLPKADVPCLAAGSTYLFSSEEAGLAREAEMRRLAPVLRDLQYCGCGERLAEGFGEAVFCHPIHVEAATPAEERRDG